MRREEYVFCIGYEGSTAIVDGRLMRRHRSQGTRQLAEAGLFKQAICSALWSDAQGELDEVLAIHNQKTTNPVRDGGGAEKDLRDIRPCRRACGRSLSSERW